MKDKITQDNNSTHQEGILCEAGVGAAWMAPSVPSITTIGRPSWGSRNF